MKEDIRKKLIEVEEVRKKALEDCLEEMIISFKNNQSTSRYNDIQEALEHIRKCESKIIGYSECNPGGLYNHYYSESKEEEKDIITDVKL